MKHVVILGGGFAGVRLARKLARHKEINITLINSSPDFKYCPAMYRSATGYKMGLSRLSLEWMLLDASRVDLVVGTVKRIDPEKKEVLLEDGTKISYDYAACALGSVTTYFNIDGLSEKAFGMKSAEEIISLRRHIHEKMLSKEHDENNYVIVGAGPTGVEMAAALGSYLKRISKKHRCKCDHLSIWLVEAAPRIMPQMSEWASAMVHKRIEKLGVKIMVNTSVKKETMGRLTTSAGSIKTQTVIWTAGTMTNPFYADHGDLFTFGPRGKVVVNNHLEALPRLYVIGDNAATKWSGLALTAVWHANYVAKDILNRINQNERPQYIDRTPVQIVPVGRRWAVLQYKKLNATGWYVALLRRAADYMGYSDIMGTLRALTIWSNEERLEDDCRTCHRK